MTAPTDRPGERPGAGGRSSAGARPRPDAAEAGSPLEGTGGILLSAAGDAARLVSAPARMAAGAMRPALGLARSIGSAPGRAAQGAIGLALRALTSRNGGAPQTEPAAERERQPAPRPAQRERPEPSRAPARERAEAPPRPGEDHVSEEAVIVGEFAESGAEDGASAQIRIDEPWDGYRRLSAQEVVRRLTTANPAAAAAVQLFEAQGRNRKSVIEAAERRLREQSPPAGRR